MEERLWYKNEIGEYVCKICGKFYTRRGSKVGQLRQTENLMMWVRFPLSPL